jgi:hypothetical protein
MYLPTYSLHFSSLLPRCIEPFYQYIKEKKPIYLHYKYNGVNTHPGYTPPSLILKVPSECPSYNWKYRVGTRIRC